MRKNAIAVVCANPEKWVGFLMKMTLWFLETGSKGAINSHRSQISVEGHTPAVLFPVYEYTQIQGWEPTHFILASLPDECKDWEIISTRIMRCRSVLVSYQEFCKLYTPKIKVD